MVALLGRWEVAGSSLFYTVFFSLGKALQHALCALELIKNRVESLAESSSQEPRVGATKSRNVTRKIGKQNPPKKETLFVLVFQAIQIPGANLAS